MKQDDTRIAQFMEALGALSAGERARLRRNAGKRLEESHRALALFFRILPPGVAEWDEPWFFLVATLFPLTAGSEKGTFGTALQAARTEENGDGLDRRVEVLLDADPSQLPFRLRQLVHYIASKEIGVNWSQLLSDLTYWSSPSRFVQERWARDYFGRPLSAPASEKKE